MGRVRREPLAQLRVESARTDAHDFREALHRRERIVEGLLLELQTPQELQIS